jgi:hypothetical protein
LALVVDTVEPYLECGIEFDECTALEAEHKIVAYGPEEAFDFSFPLGLVRFGVDQGNPKLAVTCSRCRLRKAGPLSTYNLRGTPRLSKARSRQSR